MEFLNIMHNDIHHNTLRNLSLSPESQLLIVLRYYGMGEFQVCTYFNIYVITLSVNKKIIINFPSAIFMNKLFLIKNQNNYYGLRYI